MMQEIHDDKRQAMNVAWIFVGAVAMLDALWLMRLGVATPLAPLAKSVAVAAALSLLGGFYTKFRPDPIIAALCESAAFLVCVTGTLGVASYRGQTLAMPLQDASFDVFDRAIGFDFHRHLAFLSAHATFARALEAAYYTSAPQMFGAVLLLGFTRRFGRLRVFLLLFAATAVVTIVVGSLAPALGNLAYYEIPESLLPPLREPKAGLVHVEHVLALRDGSMRVLPFDDIRGLICFPSFHTVLAILSTWAVMGMRFVFPPILALNIALIAATPSNGGHYVADIFAGAAVALCALLLLGVRFRAPLPATAIAPQPRGRVPA